MPAQAGIQILSRLLLDASLRWHDKEDKEEVCKMIREQYIGTISRGTFC